MGHMGLSIHHISSNLGQKHAGLSVRLDTARHYQARRDFDQLRVQVGQSRSSHGSFRCQQTDTGLFMPTWFQVLRLKDSLLFCAILINNSKCMNARERKKINKKSVSVVSGPDKKKGKSRDTFIF